MAGRKSRGSPVFTFRDPDGLIAEVDAYLIKYGPRMFDPKDRTKFILQAIREKLNHLIRSRKTKTRKAIAAVFPAAIADTIIVPTAINPPRRTVEE